MQYNQEIHNTDAMNKESQLRKSSKWLPRETENRQNMKGTHK
jgi:hypothetical protein